MLQNRAKEAKRETTAPQVERASLSTTSTTSTTIITTNFKPKHTHHSPTEQKCPLAQQAEAQLKEERQEQAQLLTFH